MQMVTIGNQFLVDLVGQNSLGIVSIRLVRCRTLGSYHIKSRFRASAYLRDNRSRNVVLNSRENPPTTWSGFSAKTSICRRCASDLQWHWWEAQRCVRTGLATQHLVPMQKCAYLEAVFVTTLLLAQLAIPSQLLKALGLHAIRNRLCRQKVVLNTTSG